MDTTLALDTMLLDQIVAMVRDYREQRIGPDGFAKAVAALIFEADRA